MNTVRARAYSISFHGFVSGKVETSSQGCGKSTTRKDVTAVAAVFHQVNHFTWCVDQVKWSRTKNTATTYVKDV